jgi:hypothetical protein
MYLRQEGGKARQTRRKQALRISIQSLEKHGFNVVFLIGQAEFLHFKFSTTRLPNHDGVSPQILDETRDSFVIILSASDLTWTISVRLIILP